ncbi:MAG: iron-containing alcohol dehydrogenase family protein [Pseudomonadota bacterium]
MTGTLQPFVFHHSTRRIVFAPDGISRLAELAKEAGARRAAVVMDGFFVGRALAGRIAGLLAPVLGGEPGFHFVPTREPDEASIEACRAALAPIDPDLILAVGGGSAMDTAKLARLLLANPGPLAALAGPATIMRAHPSLLICVPTTAGTGSEVSESAVASRRGADLKLILRSPEMAPHIALLDPNLTLSAPAIVTAQSGYDAVTHAVEAYVSKAASPMTDPLALAALRALARWLPVAHAEPMHAVARGHCLIAATQAAIAFNSANLGLAHAISGPLGALHGVPHGLGNALALPEVTLYNEPALGEKGAAIAAAFGADGPAAALSRLRHALGLDLGLDRFVPDEASREKLAQAAMKSGQVKMNPRLADLGHLRAILAAMRRPSGGGRPVLEL